MTMRAPGNRMRLPPVAAALTCLIGAALAQAQAWPGKPMRKPAPPYTVENNFAPIVIVTSQPLVLAAHASLKVKSAAELVALAKSLATPLPYATPSAGGTQTVAGAAFARVAGITLTNIPYKGGGQAVGDLASGQAWPDSPARWPRPAMPPR